MRRIMALGLFLALSCLGPANAQTPPTPIECSCLSCNLDTLGPPRATIADYAIFVAAFGKSTKDDGYTPRADFDRNGTVTVQDWGTMLRCCPLN